MPRMTIHGWAATIFLLPLFHLSHSCGQEAGTQFNSVSYSQRVNLRVNGEPTEGENNGDAIGDPANSRSLPSDDEIGNMIDDMYISASSGEAKDGNNSSTGSDAGNYTKNEDGDSPESILEIPGEELSESSRSENFQTESSETDPFDDSNSAGDDSNGSDSNSNGHNSHGNRSSGNTQNNEDSSDSYSGDSISGNVDGSNNDNNHNSDSSGDSRDNMIDPDINNNELRLCANVNGTLTDRIHVVGRDNNQFISSNSVIAIKVTGTNNSIEINLLSNTSTSVAGICLFLAGNHALAQVNLGNISLGHLLVIQRGNQSIVNAHIGEGSSVERMYADIGGNSDILNISGPGTYPCETVRTRGSGASFVCP